MPSNPDEDERSQDLAARSVGALLGGLAGIPFGPLGGVAGSLLGVGVEEATRKLLALRAGRAQELGEAVESRGVDADALERMLSEPRTAMLVARAAATAAETTSRLHINGLASALTKAASGEADAVDIADVSVETLSRLTDADVRVLHFIEEKCGRGKPFGKAPKGAPAPIVERLVGLGLLSFDGLYKQLNELGCLVLDDLQELDDND